MTIMNRDKLTLFSAEQTISIAFDMFVLGQGIKTGVYRVCDEVFPRLAAKRDFFPRYLLPKNPDFARAAHTYIEKKKIPGLVFDDRMNSPEDTDVLFLPFSPADRAWANNNNVVKAIIIYDLIALLREDLVTPRITTVVRSIIESITPDMVVFAISECTKKDLLAYRPDLSPSRITVIPLAAPASYAPCGEKGQKILMRKKYGIPLGVPYILSLATIEVRKNLDHVVKTFIQFCDDTPDSDTHLVLSGMKGWKLETLEKNLQQAGKWRDRIHLTGFVAEEDLPFLYGDAACFVYMSRYEGFGLPPLEAMSCGVPVVTSNTSSLPEVVGDAAICLDPDDTAGLMQAMRDLTTNAELRAELVQKGRSRAGNFSWDACADIIADTLRAAVLEKGRTVANRKMINAGEKRCPQVRVKILSSYIKLLQDLGRGEVPVLRWRALVPLASGLGFFVLSLWFILRPLAWADFGLGCAAGAGALLLAILFCKKRRGM